MNLWMALAGLLLMGSVWVLLLLGTAYLIDRAGMRKNQ